MEGGRVSSLGWVSSCWVENHHPGGRVTYWVEYLLHVGLKSLRFGTSLFLEPSRNPFWGRFLHLRGRFHQLEGELFICWTLRVWNEFILQSGWVLWHDSAFGSLSEGIYSGWQVIFPQSESFAGKRGSPKAWPHFLKQKGGQFHWGRNPITSGQCISFVYRVTVLRVEISTLLGASFILGTLLLFWAHLFKYWALILIVGGYYLTAGRLVNFWEPFHHCWAFFSCWGATIIIQKAVPSLQGAIPPGGHICSCWELPLGDFLTLLGTFLYFWALQTLLRYKNVDVYIPINL